MYTVIYRTGGTHNFKWHKSVPVESYQEALKRCEEIERAGRPALIHDTKRLDAIGLPETFAGRCE